MWPLGGSPRDSHTNSQQLLCPQLLPDLLSEVGGDLSLAEASSFLSILEGVLAEEAAPLGPAALLAVVHFLKRVTALGAGEPDPWIGPWEQLGRGVMSVASLVLEEQLAGAWLSVSEVRLAGLGRGCPSESEAGRAGAWGAGVWVQPCHWLIVSGPIAGVPPPSIRRSSSFVSFVK